MKTLRVLCLVSAFACAAANAQTCSGGADGGMDATGSQCSAPASGVDAAPPATAPTLAAAAKPGTAVNHAANRPRGNATQHGAPPRSARIGTT